MAKNSWKTSRTEAIRLALGNKVLDIAEALPTFNGGTIASLQRIRQRQRKAAKEANERSQPPQDAELRLSEIVLTEMFPLEEVDRMLSGLARLFPERRGSFDIRAELEEGARKLLGGSWYSAGIIIRQKGALWGSFPTAHLAELPEDVKSVAIEVHKIFPSMFIVSFHAALEKSANEKLKALQNIAYLPEVRFRQWLPRGSRFAGGYSETPSEAVKYRGILNWMLALRRNVERVLRKYFQGFFFGIASKNLPALPAMNVFELSGEYISDEEDRWLASLAPWLESVSLYRASVGLDIYRDNDIRVFAPWEVPKEVSYQVLRVRPKNAVRDDDRQYFRMEDIVRALVGIMGSFEVLGRIRESVEELRFNVYQRLMSKRLFHRFTKDFSVYQKVQRARLLLTRFSVEYDQQKQWLTSRADALDSFHSVGTKERTKFVDALRDGLEFQISKLKTHLNLVNTSFLDSISARNTELMYRLQFQLLAWTILVTLATAVGVIGPPTIKHWLQALWLRVF